MGWVAGAAAEAWVMQRVRKSSAVRMGGLSCEALCVAKSAEHLGTRV